MCKAENLSIEAAAEALSTTPMAILMLLRRGNLTGKEVDGGWLVNRDSLEIFLATRQVDAPLIECRSSCASKSGGCASCGSTAE